MGLPETRLIYNLYEIIFSRLGVGTLRHGRYWSQLYGRVVPDDSEWAMWMLRSYYIKDFD